MEKSYILLKLDDSTYGIKVDSVVEVMTLEESLNISYDRGIPLIDLRVLLDLEVSNSDNKEIILIEKSKAQVGLIVDNTIIIKTYNDPLLKESTEKFINYYLKEKKLVKILNIESLFYHLKKSKIIS